MDFGPDAMTEAGFKVGDILAITAGENELEALLCTSYSDVDTGSLVIRLTDEQKAALVAAITPYAVSLPRYEEFKKVLDELKY